jgi:MFS superfamily sulfate permease-like transporter
VLKKYVDADGVKHYEIYGPLFFASTTAFAEKFDVLNDPEEVVIDFRKQNCRYEFHRCRSKLTELY